MAAAEVAVAAEADDATNGLSNLFGYGAAFQGRTNQGGSVSHSSDQLPEPQRREIFLALVQAQDRGISVADSRQQTAKQFGISMDAVVRIEREGMDNEWPPL